MCVYVYMHNTKQNNQHGTTWLLEIDPPRIPSPRTCVIIHTNRRTCYCAHSNAASKLPRSYTYIHNRKQSKQHGTSGLLEIDPHQVPSRRMYVCNYIHIPACNPFQVPSKYMQYTLQYHYHYAKVKYQVDAHTQSKANSMIQVDCFTVRDRFPPSTI